MASIIGSRPSGSVIVKPDTTVDILDSSGVKPSDSPVSPGGPADLAVTLDPLNKGSSLILSNGDLTVNKNLNVAWENIKSTLYRNSGKWYWENLIGSGTSSTTNISLGCARSENTNNGGTVGESLGADGWSWWGNTGLNKFYWNNIDGIMGGNYSGYSPGDVLGILLDIDNLTLQVNVDGGDFGMSSKPPTVGGIYTPTVDLQNTGGSITANFGGSPFIYPIPAGAVAFGASTTFDSGNKGTNLVLSNGDLTVSRSVGGSWENVKGTTTRSSGKFYWELTVGGTTGTDIACTIARQENTSNTGIVGGATNNSGWSWWGNTAVNQIIHDNSTGSIQSLYSGFNIGDIVSLRMDITNLLLEASINGGAWQKGSHPLTSGGSYTPTIDMQQSAGAEVTINYGAAPFTYDIPSGFLAYNSGS